MFLQKPKIVRIRSAATLANVELTPSVVRNKYLELRLHAFFKQISVVENCRRFTVQVVPVTIVSQANADGTRTDRCIALNEKTTVDLCDCFHKRFCGVGLHFPFKRSHLKKLEKRLQCSIIICVEDTEHEKFWAIRGVARDLYIEEIYGYNAYLYDLMLRVSNPSNGGVPFPYEPKLFENEIQGSKLL